MFLLAIESSCDETAAAVIEDGTRILSSIVASQTDVHSKYGGVVPELASRAHLESIVPVVDEALEQANIELADIEAVAVTYGPGLVGSLLVGVSFAKAITFVNKKPLVAVNHLEGHLLSSIIEYGIPEFPYITLVVSGGHSNIYLVKNIGDYQLLGFTVDDAAGEAFDKVAKMLGLGYPGGPLIDKAATNGREGAVQFPRPYLREKKYCFSFSGLKTAVLTYLKKEGLYDSKTKLPVDGKITEQIKSDIARNFQDAVVDVLVDKTISAAIEYGCGTITIAGGVACNSRLREEMKRLSSEKNIKVLYPSLSYCIDNAAMIGIAGYYRYIKGERADMTLNAVARVKL